MCWTTLIIPKWWTCGTWGFFCVFCTSLPQSIWEVRGRLAMGKSSMEATPVECKEAETWSVSTSEVLLCKTIAPSGDTAPRLYSLSHAFNLHLYFKKIEFTEWGREGDSFLLSLICQNLSPVDTAFIALMQWHDVRSSRENLCCSA